MLKEFFKPYNLSTCPYAIVHYYTWHDIVDCEGNRCVSVGWHYKSVSNLLRTFVTLAPRKLISVVEQSIVNLIVGCRVFIKLKSSFNCWQPWVHIP